MKKILIGALLLSSSLFAQTYCTPSGVYGTGISGVYVGTNPGANYIASPMGTAYLGYYSYTNQSTVNIWVGSQLVIEGSYLKDKYCSAWIDYNDDGTFATADNIFSNLPTGASNNNPYDVITNPTISNTNTGVHRLRIVITDTSGQSDPCSGIKIIDFNVNINPLSNNQYRKTELIVYPNPTKDVVNFETDVDLSYELYDIDSRLIYTGSGKSIDVDGLNSGMYILKTSNQDAGISINRIIKN